MSDRKVKVSLLAEIAEYKRNMREAAKSTRDVGDEAKKAAQKTKDAQMVFDLLGKSALAAGALVATGLTVAVSKFADFDEAMSHVQAATHETNENMETLSDAALKAGANSVFSAKEAANAIEELAKAGISTADILNGGLNGALDLAAAGGIGVADAAGIAATALTQFGLTGDKAQHVADLLAAGAGKAMGDVTDLSQALNQGGLVANQFGLSIEETTGVLAAFASNGLLGSDAGTSFKTMLQRLVPQSKQAQEWMDALGLSAFDASGQFIGMSEYAGKLHNALKDMSAEQRNTTLSVLFGSDAVRAASVIYDQGAEGIQGWIDKVNDQGYAAETAALRLDNLKGDIEFLSGAIDSAAISMGEAADGPLRVFVQSLTGLVDGFNDMPSGAKQAVFWVGAVTAAVLLGGGTFLLAVPKVAAYNAAIANLGPAAQRASRALGVLAKAGAIGAVFTTAVIGVDALSDAIAKNLLPSAEQIDNKMRNAKSGVELFATALQKEGIQNTYQATTLLQGLGKELDAVAKSDFWHPANTSGTAVTVAKQLAAIAESGDMALFSAQFNKLATDADLTTKQLQTFISYNPELEDALTKQASAAGLSADAQTLLKIAMGQAQDSAQDNEKALRKLAGQANDTGDEVDDLSDQIRGFGSANVDVEQAAISFEEALDGVNESIKENGKSFDLSEKKGRQNRSALVDVAEATKELAAATYTQTGSQEQANAVITKGREALIKQAQKFGLTRDEAEKYADSLGLIPTNITTAAKLNTDQAEEQMKEFRKRWKDFTINVKAGGGGGRSESRATGGAITGPGTGTSDSIPAMLSNGEHVWTAAEVAAAGGQGAMYAMRSAVRNGSWRAYAGGGAVSSTASTSGALPPIYVQNPFTGEYLLAQVDQRADGRISSYDREQGRRASAGVRSRG